MLCVWRHPTDHVLHGQSCRLFSGYSPLHVDLDALLEHTDTQQHQHPHQQLSSRRDASQPSVLDSSNTAQAALALTSPAVDKWFEQLRSVMEEHAHDSVKWDVWAEEEDDLVVEDAHAAHVRQQPSECNRKTIWLN